MKNRNSFEKIGKRIPYEVPADFFDSITEKTLPNAKIRKQKAKKRKLVILTSAAAAVLFILAFSVLNIHRFPGIQNSETVLQSEKNHTVITEEKNLENIAGSSSNDMMPVENEQAPVLEENREYEEVTFEDLIATLTEDELMILAGQLSAEININLLIEE